MLHGLMFLALMAASADPQNDASAASSKAGSTRSPDDVVCKKFTKVGSLVAKTRLCLTRAEWKRYADRHQDEWSEKQGIKGHTNDRQETWQPN
jgi:hypothetical protein